MITQNNSVEHQKQDHFEVIKLTFNSIWPRPSTTTVNNALGNKETLCVGTLMGVAMQRSHC